MICYLQFELSVKCRICASAFSIRNHINIFLFEVIILDSKSIKYVRQNSPCMSEVRAYRSDNFVIEYIERAPCWAELVQGVRPHKPRHGPGSDGAA